MTLPHRPWIFCFSNPTVIRAVLQRGKDTYCNMFLTLHVCQLMHWTIQCSPADAIRTKAHRHEIHIARYKPPKFLIFHVNHVSIQWHIFWIVTKRLNALSEMDDPMLVNIFVNKISSKTGKTRGNATHRYPVFCCFL